MRSTVFTFFVLLATAGLGIVAFLQFRDGDLSQFFDAPPTRIGEKIYPEFDPAKAAGITLKSGDNLAHFVKTRDGWQVTSPWQDRMDVRAAMAIIAFANTTQVEDLAPRDELDPTAAGFLPTSHEVLIEDEDGNAMASFRLGRQTPWQHLPAGEQPQPIATTYLLPLEEDRKSHVYAATGNILPLFKDGFALLRDHRPFYFNPLKLQKVRLRTEQGELTLGRETSHSPWRIVKPLDLATDPEKMKALLEGLYDLQALDVTNRSEVTLPSNGARSESHQIAITPFGATEETVLEIFPPEDASARTARAMVSDRPDTLLALPLKAGPDAISISELPLTVNDLRDRTLTNLNVASIRGIAIESATAPTILVSREPPAPWIVTVQGEQQDANEQRLYDLLKAVTDTRVTSFETDAAPEDLSPWGLDRPIVKLVFLAENNQTLTISFGFDLRGDLFAKREDSATVMRLDRAVLDKIATFPHQWRHARLRTFNRIDLQKLIRQRGDEEPLELRYSFIDDQWEAFQNDEEVTSKLDPARAEFLLGLLEDLQVSTWLSARDSLASSALEDPDLVIITNEKTVDKFGDATGEKTRTLYLSADSETRRIYGKTDSEAYFFTLSPEVFLQLSLPLLDE